MFRWELWSGSVQSLRNAGNTRVQNWPFGVVCQGQNLPAGRMGMFCTSSLHSCMGRSEFSWAGLILATPKQPRGIHFSQLISVLHPLAFPYCSHPTTGLCRQNELPPAAKSKQAGGSQRLEGLGSQPRTAEVVSRVSSISEPLACCSQHRDKRLLHQSPKIFPCCLWNIFKICLFRGLRVLQPSRVLLCIEELLYFFFCFSLSFFLLHKKLLATGQSCFRWSFRTLFKSHVWSGISSLPLSPQIVKKKNALLLLTIHRLNIDNVENN